MSPVVVSDVVLKLPEENTFSRPGIAVSVQLVSNSELVRTALDVSAPELDSDGVAHTGSGGLEAKLK